NICPHCELVRTRNGNGVKLDMEWFDQNGGKFMAACLSVGLVMLRLSRMGNLCLQVQSPVANLIQGEIDALSQHVQACIVSAQQCLNAKPTEERPRLVTW